jgi:putative flavoprotein involved in K+ transport
MPVQNRPRTMNEHVETFIIGGGQAGLAMSYWLTQQGREHLVVGRPKSARAAA